MRTILVASRKGGSGKSTVAIHLAALADQPDKPALLIDCDEQASAKFWYGRRQSQTPLLAAVAPSGAAAVLRDAAAEGVETVIIDSPPHDAAGIVQLMRLAGLVVIVTRPGPLDLAAVASTIDIASGVRVPFVVLINAAPPGRGDGTEPSIVTEAREVLASLGAPVLPSYVAQRVDLSHSLISGMAVHEFAAESRASAEIGTAWRLIQKMLQETGETVDG
jgi:chromosome partitioning protein